MLVNALGMGFSQSMCPPKTSKWALILRTIFYVVGALCKLTVLERGDPKISLTARALPHL